MPRQHIGLVVGTQIETTGPCMMHVKPRKRKAKGTASSRIVLVVNAPPGAEVRYRNKGKRD